MYLKKVFWQEKEFLPEKFLLLYRLTILVKNRKTIVLARVYKNKHSDIDKLLYPGVFYKEKLQKNEIKYIKNCTNRVILYTLH